MEVSMKIKTNADAAKVQISGNMTFTTAAGLDDFIKATRIARNWLAAQKKEKASAPAK
jgi:hypothetical protein